MAPFIVEIGRTVPTDPTSTAVSGTFDEMLVRRTALTTLLVAGMVASACGSSGDDTAPAPLDTTELDTIEEAVTAETSGDPEPTSTQPPDTDATAAATADEVQMFPDVIDATAVQDGSTWTISATLSSPYDTPERYADAWRVVGPDGAVYGERILTHDHASEQPFTRSESGIEIPDDVTAVTIEGRDLEFGYGGATYELELPR